MANKKINQLVSKTSILSTDIFGIGDATTGQLFKKTIAELQAAIGGAVISVNGLVGTVVLDTDDIQELVTPTNKWFTDARARGAISLTVTGNSGASTYSSGTGVLNVPTYTLAGLGGISATFLSGTSGISYNSTTGVISYSGTVYTDASIRALLSGSTGISYNSTTGAISYSGTVYTDASVRALISLTTTGTSGASTYNNTTGVINVPNYTLAGLGGISLTSLSGGTGITYNSTTGAISYSGTVYTDSSIRSLISLTTTGTSGASTYNSTTGVLNIPQYQSVLTNPVTGTGTSGHVTYWNGSGSIAGSANHFWDNTNGRLGIGTASPSSQLHILGNTTSIFTSGLKINRSDQTGQFLTLNYEGGIVNFTAVDTAFSGPQFRFNTSTDGTTSTERVRIISAGVGIGTTSPDIFSRAYTTTLGISSSTGDSGIMINGGTSGGGYIDLGTAGTRNMGIISTTTESQIISLSTIPLVLKTNGVDRLKITSAGNIEIRIPSTTTQGLLFVDSGLTQRGKLQYDDIVGSMIFGTMSGYPTIFISNNTERMRILSNGNLCIGMTTSPYSAVSIKSNSTNKYQGFAVYAPGNENFTYVNHDGNVGWFGADSTANGYVTPIAFATNNTERMRIHTNGNAVIGTTSDPGYKLYVSGAIYATGNITANSDLTLKKNLTVITNPTDKLMQLNGYSYQWKSDDSHQYGVIAQEVEKILPYAVSTGNDGIKGVSYNQIIPVLIEAVKEQKKELEELRDILASK